MPLPGEKEYKPRLLRPYVNGIISGIVEFIATTHVLVTIKQIDGRNSVEVPGVIHREDAMYGIKDSEKLNKLFSPGDTIFGRVLSLGESGNVVISTADPAHGVVKAVEYESLETIRVSKGKITYKGRDLKRKTAVL